MCGNCGGAFTLLERGPIGANCLANPRDFMIPVAAHEDGETPSCLFVKQGGQLWVAEVGQIPLDVVAWRGNYVSHEYDLRRFSPWGRCSTARPPPSSPC